MLTTAKKVVLLARGNVSAQAAAFLARTTGLDELHCNAYIALIDGLVADGVWAELDILYVFATAAGAGALEILKAKYPQTYEHVVVQLARYDLMRSAGTAAELSADFAANLAGSSATFETFIPVLKIGGPFAKRALIEIVQKASESLVSDTLVQKSNIETGVQEKFDDDRAAKEVLKGGAVQGAKRGGNYIGKRVTPRKYHKTIDQIF